MRQRERKGREREREKRERYFPEKIHFWWYWS
jgi:hypothetical protein